MFQSPRATLAISLFLALCGCGSSSDGTEMEGGSCYVPEGDGFATCYSYFGDYMSPAYEQESCESIVTSAGQADWDPNEPCPDDFDNYCEYELFSDNGYVAYYYGTSSGDADACEGTGGVWY